VCCAASALLIDIPLCVAEPEHSEAKPESLSTFAAELTDLTKPDNLEASFLSLSYGSQVVHAHDLATYALSQFANTAGLSTSRLIHGREYILGFAAIPAQRFLNLVVGDRDLAANPDVFRVMLAIARAEHLDGAPNGITLADDDFKTREARKKAAAQEWDSIPLRFQERLNSYAHYSALPFATVNSEWHRSIEVHKEPISAALRKHPFLKVLNHVEGKKLLRSVTR